ncbi:hypothetical protein [Rhizobium fabae]|uniref:Uncharacterized protein n=1 Tax=Rhizobium fabae TaxID=573179 RepID=A0A7W6FKI4_9HYPH|nr:hypothetical protein [Rhizobium fabae]MBB3917388.1 hypothetical protein [Rhizobium fabae]
MTAVTGFDCSRGSWQFPSYVAMAKGCTIAPEKSNSLDPDFRERAGRKFERGAAAHDYHHEYPRILMED